IPGPPHGQRDETPKPRRPADGRAGRRVHRGRARTRRLDVGIGVSVFLMSVGAILAFAVNVPADGINLDTVGVILIILGLVGLLASVVFWEDWTPGGRAFGYDDGADVVIRRRRPRVVDLDDDPEVVDLVEDRPVVERRRVTTRRTTYDGF